MEDKELPRITMTIPNIRIGIRIPHGQLRLCSQSQVCLITGIIPLNHNQLRDWFRKTTMNHRISPNYGTSPVKPQKYSGQVP